MSDERVSPASIGAGLGHGALTDDTETVRVIDVQQRTVLACNRGKCLQIRGVTGHAVDAVRADQLRITLRRGPEHRIESLDIAGGVPPDRGAVASGDHAAVIDGAVRLPVEKDVSPARD